MGFSTHEIWMVLRARDEATRMMRGVSQAMRRTEAGQAAAQIENIRRVQAAERAQFDSLVANSRRVTEISRVHIGDLEAQRNKVVDVGRTYTKETNTRIADIQRQARAQARAHTETIDGYRSQILNIREQGAIDTKTKQNSIAALQRKIGWEQLASRESARTFQTEIDGIKSAAAIRMADFDTNVGERNKLINLHKETDSVRAQSMDTIKRSQGILKEVATQEIADQQRIIDMHNQKINKLQGVGQAAMLAGTGFLIMGGLAMSGFATASQASIDYRQAAMLTFTQVDDKAEFSADWIIATGKKIGKQYPVEFGSIQPALYDLFSSIEIKSKEVAEVMIANIAKAAVGGAVTMEVAGKGVLEIINAWGMNIDDVSAATVTLNRVNDVAFMLVKEGVGSYQQFSDAIGRSIPSAVKAGATYEDMAGGLAFMTRMGMSTAMASTSLGRAFDLVSNPKFEQNMKKYGMTTRDASGNFLQMTDIVDQLKNHTKDMSEGQLADFLKNVTFGAGGTVQAMRFLNHAVHDSEGLLNNLTDAMYNSAGAADMAYDIMSQTPEAKIQELANQFEIFKITIGDTVNVAIMPLVNALTQVFDWFNNLSPEMQQTITIVAMVTAGISVLLGIVLLIGGAFALMVAAVGSVSAVFTVLLGPAALVVGAIVAIIAIIVLCINYWPEISAAAIAAWDWIVGVWNGFAEWFMGLWNGAIEAVVNWYNNTVIQVQALWDAIVGFFANLPAAAQAMWDELVAQVVGWATGVGSTIQGFWDTVVGFFSSGVGEAILQINPLVVFFTVTLPAVWDSLVATVAALFLTIVAIFQGDTDQIKEIWSKWGQKILEIWNTAKDKVWNAIKTLWTSISDAFNNGIKNVIAWWENLKMQLTIKAINMMLDLAAKVQNGIDTVVTFFRELPGKVVAGVTKLASDLQSQGQKWLSQLLTAVSTGATNVINFFQGLPGRIISTLSSAAGQMVSVGSNMIQGLIRGITAAAGRVASAAMDVVKGAINAAKNVLGIKSPSKVFEAIGIFSGEGLAIGLKEMEDQVSRAGMEMAAAAIHPVVVPVSYSGTGSSDTPSNNGSEDDPRGNNITVNVHTEEIDPEKHAADLGYEIGNRLGW